MGVLIATIYCLGLLPLAFAAERGYRWALDRIEERRFKAELERRADEYLDCLGTLQRRNDR